MNPSPVFFLFWASWDSHNFHCNLLQVREQGEQRDAGGGEERPGRPLGRPARRAERRPGGGRPAEPRLGGATLPELGAAAAGSGQGDRRGRLRRKGGQGTRSQGM